MAYDGDSDDLSSGRSLGSKMRNAASSAAGPFGKKRKPTSGGQLGKQSKLSENLSKLRAKGALK